MVINSIRIYQYFISSLEYGYRYLQIVMTHINKIGLPYEIRHVQDNTRTLFVTLPKRFTKLLKIRKGDLLKIQLESDTYKGNSLVMTKIRVGEGD